VIAATNHAAVNQLCLSSEQRNLLVNSVDDIPNCRFMVPAIIDRSPLVISVASNGASPVLSRQLRTQIETLFHMVWVNSLSFLDNGVSKLRKNFQSR
jgi:uroporphyrin-III C-methyltransferase/precorrin-2 dehydrogenase/sirohydrochlorin ferrochelatase